MAGVTVPSKQMVGLYTHALTGRKGWPQITFLNNQGKIAETDATLVRAGATVHANAEWEFEAGATGVQMPLFLTSDNYRLDVATGVSNSLGGQVMPQGFAGVLVGSGSFELETTEFDNTVSYVPNDALVAPTQAQVTGSDKTGAGLLYNKKNWTGGGGGAFTVGVDKIVGVATWGRRTTAQGAVSGSSSLSPYNTAVLAFWPVYTAV